MVGDNTRRIPMEGLVTRLALGIDMLRRHDDPEGSSAACEFVIRAILEEGEGKGGSSGGGIDGSGRMEHIATMVSSMSTSSLDAYKTRTLSKALLCVGEAALASWSSPLLSSSYHRGPHYRSTRDAALVRARESLEAATAVDPTDPAVRCGLGLTYLILGTMKYDDKDNYDNDNDSSLRYIFRSIQHLRTAVGLADAASSQHEGRADDDDYDEAIDAVRYAASHNLGLAYIALDGKSPSLDGGKQTTHFADWARSSPWVMKKTLAFASNVGAMMLQMGMFEDAASTLGSTASEFCGNDSLPSGRQEEACSIVRINLAVARAALNREMEGPNYARANDPTIESNQFDGDVLSSRSEDVLTPSNDDDVSQAAHETPDVPSFIDEGEPESNLVLSNESTSSGLEIVNIKEAIDVKPEMRNALVALEKAATEGTQRTRLLLALARARSSTGDFLGAVDASLKAISASTSDEEMESSTSYLESLIETMAKQNSEEIGLVHEESTPKASGETPTNRDYSLLEMKLELERLKYKVLDQEMRLRYQNYSPNPVDDVTHVIGYQKQEYTLKDAPRRALSEIKQNRVTGQILTKLVDHVQDEIHEIQEISNVAADDIQEVSSIVADDGGPVVPESSTSSSDIESSSIANVTLTEYQNSDAAADPEFDAQADDLTSKTDAEVDFDSNTEVDAQSLTKTHAEVIAKSIAEPDVEFNTESIVDLPVLFSPELKPPAAIPPTAKSYMKMADAYLDKGQFVLASKQFLKVMRKAPDHLPAYLGYATALERTGKGRQIHTAALAYGNATKLAIIQGTKVDSMAKAGTGGIAENILRRAVALTKAGDPSGRLETLLQLATYAHTNALAADIYHEIGLEMSKQGIDRGRVVQAFTIANEFVAIRNDAEAPFHIRSIIGLCKSMFLEGNVKGVIDLFNKVKNLHMEDDLHTELLVLVGRAHAKLGDMETAISEFTRALAFPLSSSTPLAHHELASALKKSNGDNHEINLHYEYALEKGMDVSPEAIESLGERNIHVMRALNRQYYKNVNGGESTGRSSGGIMSGTGVGSQSSSVFAPKAKQNEDSIAQSDTLSILEQGAASYDGHSPMGGEVEGIQSSLSNLKAAKQQGSESRLQKLQR
ncbi:hypothetical protein ACHAXA_008293 [Cyclostephanos tholiformis]|uniref:Uncharacterized protein n=1 Tax=Cyclostephanos tholiformis TaxID=382380 RepID=A0ABD3RJN8_9STRA